MSLYHHFLFQTITPGIPVGIGTDVSGKKVLIVDDTLHTGATIDVVVKEMGTKEMGTGTIFSK